MAKWNIDGWSVTERMLLRRERLVAGGMDEVTVGEVLAHKAAYENAEVEQLDGIIKREILSMGRDDETVTVTTIYERSPARETLTPEGLERLQKKMKRRPEPPRLDLWLILTQMKDFLRLCWGNLSPADKLAMQQKIEWLEGFIREREEV